MTLLLVEQKKFVRMENCAASKDQLYLNVIQTN